MNITPLSKDMVEKLFTHSSEKQPSIKSTTISKGKIMQFGTGAFLRGFVDYFLQNALDKNLFDPEVYVIESTGSGRSEILKRQDFLFTNITEGFQQGKTIRSFQINQVIKNVFSSKSQSKKIIDLAKDPMLCAIISNTTEAGLVYQQENLTQFETLQSFPAKLTYLLWQRFLDLGNHAPLCYILPCELLVNNGKLLYDIVLKHVEENQLPEEFKEWLHIYCSFCNTLVDRIVPGLPQSFKKDEIETELGYRDDMLNIAEVYKLWAIESNDRILTDLPFLNADDGIIVCNDIEPFRERKLRLLNGGHTFMVAFAWFKGFTTVAESLENKDFETWFVALLEEIVDSLNLDKTSSMEFAKEVHERFKNPFLHHQLLSISLQYGTKMNMRNLTSIQRYLENNSKVPMRMAEGFAAFLAFMRCEQNKNEWKGMGGSRPYSITDAHAEIYAAHWKTAISSMSSKESSISNNESNKENISHNLVELILSDTQLWSNPWNKYPEWKKAVVSFLISYL